MAELNKMETKPLTEADIRELFESVGIEATEDQISSVAFELNTTIEEYEHQDAATPQVFNTPEPPVEFRKNCKRCGGSGWIFEDIEDFLRCPECDGYGVERRFQNGVGDL